jgi:hypothetical protein
MNIMNVMPRGIKRANVAISCDGMPALGFVKTELDAVDEDEMVDEDTELVKGVTTLRAVVDAECTLDVGTFRLKFHC